MFLMLFCSNSVHFSEILLVCDGQTDGQTDEPTDGPTDIPSYRDARTHLKIACQIYDKLTMIANYSPHPISSLQTGIDRNFKLYLVENGKKQLQRLGGKSDSFIPSDTWVYSKDVYLLEAP